jgi:hypothetical protein
MGKNEVRKVTINIDEQRWKGLRAEADLMSRVFNMSFTPEDVLQTRMERELKVRRR